MLLQGDVVVEGDLDRGDIRIDEQLANAPAIDPPIDAVRAEQHDAVAGPSRVAELPNAFFVKRYNGGEPAFSGSEAHGFSALFRHFLAGQLACLREMTLLLAPNINSYKRYAEGSFAPTTVAWGRDYGDITPARGVILGATSSGPPVTDGRS